MPGPMKPCGTIEVDITTRDDLSAGLRRFQRVWNSFGINVLPRGARLETWSVPCRESEHWGELYNPLHYREPLPSEID